MTCYIATKISNRESGLLLAYKLTRLGAQVTSRWMEVEKKTRPEERSGKAWEAFARQWGQNDVDDVLRSDDVVILSVDEGMRGTWVEFGLALASNKKIHWIGGRDQTVFTRLEQTPGGTPIAYYLDMDDFLEKFEHEFTASLDLPPEMLHVPKKGKR